MLSSPIPDFIRTKWKSRGAAVVQISNLSCEECQKEWYTFLKKGDEEHQINATKKCSLHSKYITCYMSALDVWEYKFRPLLLNEETSSEEEYDLEETESVEGDTPDGEDTENSHPVFESEDQSPNDGANEKYREPWYVIFSPFWWFGCSLYKEECTLYMCMKKAEEESLNHFVNAFHPKVKENSYAPLFSSKNLHITKVEEFNDGRIPIDTLIKIEMKANNESGASPKIYVHYMVEDDIDNEVHNIINKDARPHTLELSGPPLDGENLTVTIKEECQNFDDNLLNCPKVDKIENEPINASKFEDWLCNSKVIFDENYSQVLVPVTFNLDPLRVKMKEILSRHYRLMRFTIKDKDNILFENLPPDFPEELTKYWIQRYRLFLKYDEDIKLNNESWFSATPEIIAAHQAYRCSCDTVVDAFCGSGSNAIQLALTCNRVIAIDLDSKMIEIARHNARVYGVEDRMEFIQGDFFQLASSLKADAVLLAPPWGGINYNKNNIYDVLTLEGSMNCKLLVDTARKISQDIALYIPKSSNLLQVIELAGVNGKVDIEFHYMAKKRKAITAYYGALADCFEENSSP